MNTYHKSILCVALGVAFARSVFAADAIMTNTTEKTVSWNTAGNWTDSSGAVLTSAPFAADDNVSFKALARPQGLAAVPRQTVAIATADRTIGTIAGDDRRTIQFTKDATGSQQSEHSLTITDPTAFLGFWTVGNAFSTFIVPNGATLSSLSGKARPGVKVGDGETVALGTVYSAGTVDKVGAGTLAIGATTGDDTTLNVKEGAVVLEGSLSDAALSSVLAQAAAHFDASATNTWTRRADGDRVWVDEWTAVSDSTLKARKSNYEGSGEPYISKAESPFVSSVLSPSGLPLVDFGSGWKSSKGELGPTNCLLELNRTITGIKTVFYVVQGEKGLDCSTVLGGRATYDFIANAWLGNTTLFATGAAKVDVMHGEYQLNGTQTSHEELAADKLTDLSVISIDLDGTGSASFDMFGSDRYMRTSSGGFRLGEAIVFTNHLARADRLRVSRYLVNKWKGAAADPLDDVGSMRLVQASASVGVAAGRTARVGSVDAVGKAITKTGAGELVLDVVTPASTAISVSEGTLAVDKVLPDVTDDAPTPGAYIWLDARTLSSAEVTTWPDCRSGVSTKAVSLYASPRVPTLVANAVGSYPAVNFGLKANSNHAGMKFDNWDASRAAYAGFIVVRMTALNQTCNIFGSNYQDMIRDNAATLAASVWASTHTVAARWSINGRIVDPLASEADLLNQTNSFVLVGFTSQSPLGANGVSQSRSPAYYPDECGGIEVAEMIVYNKKLTEAERRQTEAYLMKRWQLGDHPAAGNARAVAKVTFANAAEARIGGARDLTVGKVTGGNGTLVKTGSGDLTISEPDPAAVSTGVRVESGALAIAFEPVDLLSRATFRFDASDTSSLVCQCVDNGDGTVTTNVTRWLDANRNGYNARSTFDSSVYNYCSYVKAHPTVKSARFPDGKYRAVVDFGTVGSATDAAGMSIYNNNTYVEKANVREVFTVYADAHYTSSAAGQIVGSSAYHFLRGPDWNDGGKRKLLLGYASSYVRNGYIAVDGVVETAELVLDKKFHVVSFGATALVIGNMMCQERMNAAGGSQIAEQVAFNFELTAAQRAMVESYLMRKWLGDDSRVNTLALGALELGADASFSAAGATVSLPSLASSDKASLAAESVTDVATVRVAALDRDVPAITVSAAVSFANAVTLTIDEPILRSHDGLYPILRATSLSQLDLSAWTLHCDRRCKSSVELVVVNGNTICLKVVRRGMMLIVR